MSKLTVILTVDQKKKFRSLLESLSPENLSCDGYLSKSRIIQKSRKLRKEWKQLEKEVGRKVEQEEAETFN